MLNADTLAQQILETVYLRERLKPLTDDDLLREFKALCAELDARNLDAGRKTIRFVWADTDDNSGHGDL